MNDARKSLSVLSISGDSLVTENGWIILSAFISHPMCMLQSLRIAETRLGHKALICLGAALVVNRSVVNLDLSGCSQAAIGGFFEMS